MSQLQFLNTKQFFNFGIIRLLAVLASEFALIHFARHQFGFECYRDGTIFCGIARNLLLASYGLSAVLILLGLFDRHAFIQLLKHTEIRPIPLMVNAAGLAALVMSLPLLRLDPTASIQLLIAVIWLVAVPCVIIGALLMIAPFRAWKDFLSRLGIAAPIAALLGAAAPFVATHLRPVMDADVLSGITFNIVERMLLFIGTNVETIPEDRIIGADDFFVNIAPSCSGIEGLVLTTTFATIYLALFRRNLRFPNALLILPVALATSWALNAVRIAVLVQLGISGYPSLAIGGFHSHAGWLMFTILSLGIVLAAQSIPFFHTTPEENGEADTSAAKAAPLPFFSDPVVAQIFPFLIFMASALLASTFVQDPALAYPVRAAAIGFTLALFWPYLETLPWRIDPLAVGAGVAIALLWGLTATPSDDPHITAEMSAMGAMLWIVTRCLGTTLFVPVIEELFFRGYLMRRIAPDTSSKLRVVLAVGISTALFAALHDRWIEAAIAGLIFAALTLRSRDVTDAILAHAVANGLIALWAFATGNWSMI